MRTPNNDSWDDYKAEIAKKDEPKVWLTADEAKFVVQVLYTVWDSQCISMNQDYYNNIVDINRKIILQTKQAEEL